MIWRTMSTDEREATIRAALADGATLTDIGRSVGISRSHAARSIRLFCDTYGIPYELRPTVKPEKAVYPKRKPRNWNLRDEELREWVVSQDRAFVAAVRKAHFGVPA